MSIGSIHAGNAPNVIPGEVKFGGVSRAFNEEVREVIRSQMFDIAKGMESISGCSVDIYHYYGYPAAYNDPGLVSLARAALTKELGSEALVELEKPAAFSEDFAYYYKDGGVPSAFFLIYAGHEGDKVYPLHNAKCAMKEEVMPYGARALAAMALEYLNA